MKLAVSSASFASELASGTLTQLEWLDLCAAELEADGVVLDLRHFPRRDDAYLAQVKKTAVDLGLTLAGVAAAGVEESGLAIDAALGLGAALVTFAAPAANDDPGAFGEFSARLKDASARAKASNVPLALRNQPATLCESGADLKRVGKDVDSSWLRFALDVTSLTEVARSDALLRATILGVCTVTDIEAFARAGNSAAVAAVAALRGYRGFVLVERDDARGGRDAFHRALTRLQAAAAAAFLSGNT